MREELIRIGLWASDDLRDPSLHREAVQDLIRNFKAKYGRGFWNIGCLSRWTEAPCTYYVWVNFKCVAKANTLERAICLAALALHAKIQSRHQISVYSHKAADYVRHLLPLLGLELWLSNN